MANTLTNFLIGIGLDFDKKGAKEVDNSIDSIKRTALQAGAAVAGAFGIKSLTKDFADAKDQLGQFSKVFGVIPDDVNAIGLALKSEGGSLESFMNQLSTIQKMRAGLLTGDAGWLATAARAGIDPSTITNAKNATDAYRALADQMQRMTWAQRLNAAKALGLDNASIILLSKGSAAFDKQVDSMRKLQPITKQMTDESRRFQEQWNKLWAGIGGASDRAASQILPAVNDIIGGINDWYESNQKLINQDIDKVFGFIADHLGSIAVSAGLIASSGMLGGFSKLSGIIPGLGVGLKGMAGSLARISAVGAVASMVPSAASAADKLLSSNVPGYDTADAWITKKIYEGLGVDLSRGKVYSNPTTITPSDVNKSPMTFTPGNTGSIIGMQPTNQTNQTQTKVMQPIQLRIDGKVIKDMVVETMEDQSEQSIIGLESPYKG